MKRDMDLVRKILQVMEDHPHGYAPHSLRIEGYSAEQIGYHAYEMKQAGLIEAADRGLNTPSPMAIPLNLTWAGHDFIEAAQNETIWRKALKQVKEKAGSVTIEVMKEYLKHLTKEALGIA